MQEPTEDRPVIQGQIGLCGARRVFLGFAPAGLLHRSSFADVLDETTGTGYQRRFAASHSLEFRKYIQSARATTIPLTFNLRPNDPAPWALHESPTGSATLQLDLRGGPVLAQVDCQHRLGFLKDLPISLAFMTFVGLTIREEMEVFSIINSKAKGLNSSLLDFHESRLTSDLSTAKPEIYIALRLNELEESPWRQRLDLGGSTTVGMRRYASLRTMQKAVRRFLRTSRILDSYEADEALRVVVSFWRAVSLVLAEEWRTPRRNFVTKGIGVYSLMSLAADLFIDARRSSLVCDEAFFAGALSDFLRDIDWSSAGPLRGFGGAAGADQALALLRNVRARNRLKVLTNG
jgi:DGQHR domain-containing protein